MARTRRHRVSKEGTQSPMTARPRVDIAARVGYKSARLRLKGKRLNKSSTGLPTRILPRVVTPFIWPVAAVQQQRYHLQP